jgi:tetratricopeptide (TPR) repeat protein
LKNILLIPFFLTIIILNIFSINQNDINYIIDQYIRFNKWQEAKKELESYLKVNPTDTYAYSIYSEVLYELQLYDDAILATRTAINYEKNDEFKAELYNNLGFYYYCKGLNDLAIEMYQKSISLRADIDTTYYNLGKIYIDKEDYDNALNSWKKYINLTSNIEKKTKIQNIIAKLEKKILEEKIKKEEEERLKEEFLKQLKEDLEKDKTESKSLEADKNKTKHSEKELEEID